MIETISYVSIWALAFVFAVLAKNGFIGFTVSSVASFVWIGLVGFGPFVDPWDAKVLYGIVSLTGACLGWAFAMYFSAPPVLDILYLRHTYEGLLHKNPVQGKDPNGVARVLVKTFFFITLLFVSHVLYEITDLNEPIGGLLGTLGLIISYVVWAFLIRRETSLFKSTKPKEEARTYILVMAVIHIITFLVYWILDAVRNNVDFYDNRENFIALESVSGILLLLMLIIGAFTLRDPVMRNEYNPLPKEEEA